MSETGADIETSDGVTETRVGDSVETYGATAVCAGVVIDGVTSTLISIAVETGV